MTFYNFVKENFLNKFRILFNKQSAYLLDVKYSTEYISFNEFNERKVKILDQILLNISNKVYSPQTLYPILTPKQDGSLRLICIPCIQDRIIQQLILEYIKTNHIAKYNLATDHDFSSKKDAGGAIMARTEALSLRNQYSHVLKTDISSFFDNLDRKLIQKTLKEQLDLPELNFLLQKIVNTDIKLPPLHSIDIKELEFLKSKQGKGIRQGMPMSSFISSLYLYEFDSFMVSNKIKYIRYADDLIVFNSSYKESKNNLNIIIEQLSKIKLTVPSLDERTKTNIVKNKPVDFLGLVFEFRGTKFKSFIPNNVFLKVIAKIDNYDSLNKNLKNKKSFSDVIQDINYISNGYKAAFSDACNIGDLEQEINAHKIKIFTKLLGSIGVDISKLSLRQKKFFFSI